ncbi:MAG TPA: N-acetylglucosamine-6-phosphate deacetylase [Panacibacter sp.]|nr:N-acetylglucosamine-6-phosphate deacetylase [Panacibacter sp.]
MIYKAAKVFTGHEILQYHAVAVSNGVIESVFPANELSEKQTVTDFGDVIIAPAYIDIQLYGAHGRLLAVYPDAATVKAIVNYCTAGGATHCIPTVATNPYETIFQCIDAIKSYWAQGGKGVLGLHVEGPWINPEKRGAHRTEWIFSPTIEQTKQLLDYGKDVIKIITIAPECCSQEVTNLIHSYNIVVSAGHSNATYNQATNFFDKGIHTATHLYNAMSALQHRAPGMVGAVFNNEKVRCSIVPDGHHVDFAAIKIAKKIMGERLFAITDAVTETTKGYYRHTLEKDKYTSNGILSGSALTMHKCFLNFVQHCDIEVEEALRMCSLYPATVMHLQKELGMIKENYKADMVVINNDLELIKVIVS